MQETLKAHWARRRQQRVDGIMDKIFGSVILFGAGYLLIHSIIYVYKTF